MKKYINGNLKNPNLFLFFAIVSSAIVLILVGTHTYNVMEDVLENSKQAQIERNYINDIRFYDEVLTNSALLAASTGNLQWEKRYRIFEPKLDTVIKVMLRLDTLNNLHIMLKMTDNANVRLVAMENRVFELVRDRKLNEAVAIMTGSEYARQKAIYSEGLSKFIKLLELKPDQQQTRLRKAATHSKWFLGLVILFLAIVWLPIERILRKSRAQMLEQNQELELQITERKNNELKLKESEEKYRILAEASPEMIYLIDTKGYVTYVNKVAAAQFRAPAHELVGKHLKDIFPPDLAQQNLAGIQDVIATKSNFQSEVEMVFPTGTRWVDARLTPVFDEKNNVIGVLGLSYDITERKKTEEKINMLAHAVKNSADCIAITDKDYQIIFVNDSFCKVYGYKEEEVVGQPIAVITSNNNLPEVGNDLYSSISKKVTWTGEVLNKRKDGNDFPVQLSLAPLLNDKGELIAVVGVLRDITERKQAEEALHAKMEELDRFFKTNLDLLCIADTDGYFHRLNLEWEKTLGYALHELVGAKVLDFVHPDDIEATIAAFGDLSLQKEVLNFTNRYRSKDGTYRWIEWRSIPAGKLIYAAARDITGRIHTEAEIKKTNAALTKLNAEKDKFFSIIAHDLKTPFNSIIGFSEILVEQVMEKNYQGIEEYTGIILQSSQRAMDLLMNLMEWSRSQTGKMEFNPAYFQMTELINEVELLLDNAAGQKSIVITNSLPDNIAVYADKNMMSAVLRNLISNAIKFTRPGGEIIISAEEKEELTVSVSDNGVGIPKDRIEQLFRIDENYSTSGTQNERGTGLGLILCKEFIEKHGGKIWVESVEGKGSIFYFTIP